MNLGEIGVEEERYALHGTGEGAGGADEEQHKDEEQGHHGFRCLLYATLHAAYHYGMGAEDEQHTDE